MLLILLLIVVVGGNHQDVFFRGRRHRFVVTVKRGLAVNVRPSIYIPNNARKCLKLIIKFEELNDNTDQ